METTGVVQESGLEPSDAIPVCADDVGAPFVRVATDRTTALATWDAMCRVEQALRERRGS